MNVLIRCELGSPHGMGHASRMLALARYLISQGATVSFVTTTEALQGYVTPFRCDLCAGWNAVTTPCGPGDVLIIDTKASDWANDDDALWLARDAGLKIVRIDHPVADPDSCDLLVAPGNHWAPETVTRLWDGFGARFLYGWDYVMLATEVTQLESIPYQERARGPVVFCAGGSDPTGALQQMFVSTKDLNIEGRVLIFLQGALTENPLQISTVRHRYCPRMVTSFSRDWIRKASLLVTMFGQTCYEALYWKTPQLILSHTIENTVGAHCFDMETKESSCFQGSITTTADSQGKNLCSEITSHLSCAANMSTQAQGLLDGQGLRRVAQAILEL